MFRNNYDNDSVTFSPQGRIFQIEYAGEAVKQGSVVVGISSATHVVLVALKRNAEELSSYQQKLFPISENIGIAIAGLTSDARVLSNFMRSRTLLHSLNWGRHMPLHKLVDALGEKAQYNTQHYGRRPYGVGLLIAGIDEKGTHLYNFQPSGDVAETVAFAIGARSQMARTYLESHVGQFATCSREDLVLHGLKALRESMSQDKELTPENTSIGILGRTAVGEASGRKTSIEAFQVYDGDQVKEWLSHVTKQDDGGEGNEGNEGNEGGDDGDRMEVDS